MSRVADRRSRIDLEFTRGELTGAIGDVATVLPIVVAVAVLTELSLAMMLVWFGVFQLVWGLYYGVPISVEPMKALAALVLAGTITTGEFMLAGLMLGALLVAIGVTGTLDRLGRFVGTPVVRGIQLGVALVLLDTGVRLGLENQTLAAGGVLLAVLLIAIGYWNVSPLVVLGVGGAIAAFIAGVPTPLIPGTEAMMVFDRTDLTRSTFEATAAQFAMTVGNAALATSVLLADYYDRDIGPDELSTSMGVMNLVAIPFGAFPMCHGSGGVAGKYAFGARTAVANVLLGMGYLLVAVLAVGIVAAYPVAILGVVLAMIAFELGRTSLVHAEAYGLVIAIGLIGLFVNLGVAFVVGVIASLVYDRMTDGDGPMPISSI